MIDLIPKKKKNEGEPPFYKGLAAASSGARSISRSTKECQSFILARRLPL
jgi:hypothetical protein